MMEAIKPGGTWWGGSDEYVGDLIYPVSAANKWQDEIGWEGQHLLHLRLTYNMAGVDAAIDLAKRIVDGGGFVQVGIWGTPKELASVDTSRTEGGRVIYPKYPPRDTAAWCELYIKVVQRFLKVIPADRIMFNVWMEAITYFWRASDGSFYKFYGEVQRAIERAISSGKLPSGLLIGGTQVNGLSGQFMGPNQPWYTQTHPLEWQERFFHLATRHGWQVDFWDIFDYSTNVDHIIGLINETEQLMVDCQVDHWPLVFNCLSSGGSQLFDEKEDAEHTMRLAKAVLKQTTVERAGFDFVEDVGPPGNSRYRPDGLLEYGSLRERPRWDVAKRIIQAKAA